MYQNLAESLSRKFRIAREVIIREEYEMIFLQSLLASKFYKSLIFKGGTALRLAYNSSRFSEDLDFSLTEEIKNKDFIMVVEKVAKDLPAVKLKEATEKYHAHFAILQIKEPYLKQAFPLKIEISKRPVNWQEDKDFIAHELKSQVVPIEAVGFVVTLERAFKDKKKMITQRNKARDLFDLWWLAQKLNKKVEIKIKENEVRKIKAELNQFLPEPMRLVIDSWRKK